MLLNIAAVSYLRKSDSPKAFRCVLLVMSGTLLGNHFSHGWQYIYQRICTFFQTQHITFWVTTLYYLYYSGTRPTAVCVALLLLQSPLAMALSAHAAPPPPAPPGISIADTVSFTPVHPQCRNWKAPLGYWSSWWLHMTRNLLTKTRACSQRLEISDNHYNFLTMTWNRWLWLVIADCD